MATHRARSGRTAGASERASAGALAGRRKRRLRPDEPDARNEVIANVTAGRRLTLEKDEEGERTVGLLLLCKGAVLAHVFGRPLAVEMDESQ